MTFPWCVHAAEWLTQSVTHDELAPQFLEEAREALEAYKGVMSMFSPSDWNTLSETVWRPSKHVCVRAVMAAQSCRVALQRRCSACYCPLLACHCPLLPPVTALCFRLPLPSARPRPPSPRSEGKSCFCPRTSSFESFSRSTARTTRSASIWGGR